MEAIGLIGVGRMGGPMARRLLAAGWRVVVADSRPEAVAALVEEGAAPAAGPAEMASLVETVLLSLPTPEIVEAVVLGPGGLIAGTRLRTCIDLSTTGPRMARRVAEGLAGHGIALIDAPVSGGVAGAEAGTLAIMAAAPAALFARHRDLLAAIGRPFHVGTEPGQGQMMKLVNNLLSAAALAASSEAVVLGARAGLDPRVMIEVINAGSGRNSATLDKFPRAILPRTFDAGFATGLLCKDLRLCLEAADGLGVPLGVGTAVADLWQQALARNGADSDFTTIVQVVEALAGLELPASGEDGGG
jgi:3-hydroxyisobutyrate dehydrogenase-like beta-hydroxyacid dehydrogenase